VHRGIYVGHLKESTVADFDPLRQNHRVTGTTFRMAPSGMLRRVALARTDVSEEFSASITRVTIISELGKSFEKAA
jgi:hypothetical protein